MTLQRGDSTRSLILHLLKTKGQLSVSELAGELGITEMAVRRHLHSLERDRLIQTQLIRQAMGRPIHLYSLSNEADHLFPKNYHDFALDMLMDLEEIEGPEKIEALFSRREEKLRQRYAAKIKGKDLGTKIDELTRIQNEKGYMAEWESDKKGNYILREFNCPISHVAKEFNQACESELSLFEKVLDAKITRAECLAKGGDCCIYIIEKG
ncbi:transcriptional regulator [Microaerobacter geothermalis]|uniref:helix-turn-helix transcriptional regulator n=1 Tax=Microaerobacter geothermalis TaxID=674972 RepID=UPI001F3B095B|nr:metalloregulator ArsR/SmtB family transcription factor [Microaerobacter geothermalis]MCF6092427.1 transcriptional regulator [Microaerobacter geothermalis]